MGRTRPHDVEDALDTYDDMPVTQKKRCGVDDLHLAFVVEKGNREESRTMVGPWDEGALGCGECLSFGRSR